MAAVYPSGTPPPDMRSQNLHPMTLTLDRSWGVLFAIAIVACLAMYWQAKNVERSTRVLPADLGLQLEDVSVGLGDERYLAGP